MCRIRGGEREGGDPVRVRRGERLRQAFEPVVDTRDVTMTEDILT
jgi:hypothetical protein